MGLHQIKKLYTGKEAINKTEGHPTEWENIFADTSNKGLISKIYKEFIKFDNK